MLGPARLAEGGAEGFGIGHDGVARKVHASQERCAASTWPAPQIELFPHLGHKHGRSWVAEAIRTQQDRYSSRKYEIKLLSVDGAKVATIQRLRLRKRSDDRVVRLEVAEFFTLRGGRILEHRGFFDSFDLVQQLLGQDLTDAFAASVRNAMRG